MSVLDYIRKIKKLKGTKEGCREGDCGACTVLIGELTESFTAPVKTDADPEAGTNSSVQKEISYRAVNSCLVPAGMLQGKHLVTIEGLNGSGLTRIQANFLEEAASQCGFCTPGFIISLTGYFLSHKNYNLNEAVNSVAGNICRCTGYASIKRAIENVVTSPDLKGNYDRISLLIKENIIPEYFAHIPGRLSGLNHALKDYHEFKKSDITIAGGTDLMVKDWQNLFGADLKFVSRKNNDDLIRIKDERCFIDASATITDLIISPVLNKIIPGTKKYLSLFGSLPVRNLATIGGNIVNASPIADSVIFFLPFNPEINLSDGRNERTICLKELYLGYKKLDKKEDELITSLSFLIPTKILYFNFEKVSRREHLDIASVNSAICLEIDINGNIHEVNISAGGVAPYPLILKKTSEFLKGKQINSKNISQLYGITLSEISPISDVRGSAEYKSLLLRQIILSHFMKLFPDLIRMEEVAL